MDRTMLDSIREFAARPWRTVSRVSQTVDDCRYRDATPSQLLAANEAVARFIRDHGGADSEVRTADLAHHLDQIRCFDAIAKRCSSPRR